jgi:predicted RND superfamily exporter protein
MAAPEICSGPAGSEQPAAGVVMDPLVFSAIVAAGFALALAGSALWPRAVIAGAGFVLLALLIPTALSLVALLERDPLRIDLAIDPSTEPLLPRGDPARAAYLEAVKNFGDDQVYAVAMETDDIFQSERLHALRRVTDSIARLPEVRRVQSLTDVIAFRYEADGDWIEVTSLIEDIPEDAAALEALRARTLQDPLYRRTLVSDDGGTASVNVTLRELTDNELIDSRLDARILEILAGEEREGVRFHVAGRPHIKDRVYHLMLDDMRLLIPIALLVVAVGLGIVFGTRRGVTLPLSVISLATLWTFGAMATLELPLTVLTTLLAPTLAAVGSVYGIHVIAQYEEEALHASGPREAALSTLEQLRLPVLVAGFTTMIGFGALLITEVPAVFEVGSFAVLGIASITLLSLVGMPAALAFMPLRPAGAGTRLAAQIATTLDARLESLAGFSARHSRTILVVFGVVFAGCLASIPNIVVDTDYLSFFDEDSPIRQEFEAVDRLLAGAIPLYVSLQGEGAGAFREPEALRAIERIQQQAETSPHVRRTLSMPDTVRVMNRAMAADDPAEERIPDSRGGVAELVFLAPKGHLDRYSNVNHSRANVLVRTGAVGTAAVGEVVAHLERALADAGLPDGVSGVVTGNALLLAHSADGIAAAQPKTIGLAALAIFVLVSISFRSPRLGVVAMVPNLVPVVIYFGGLGLGLAPLSLPTSLIGSVALGISIDDTAHFLVRYGKERRNGLSPEAAAEVSGRRIGRAISITSLMLIAGFGVVALSGFATLQQFGLLTAGTMAVCLINDLVLLPALLVRSRA